MASVADTALNPGPYPEVDAGGGGVTAGVTACSN